MTTLWQEKYELKTFKVGLIDTNCYILINRQNKKAAIIDPGFLSRELLNFLEEENIKVWLILLTHGHFDHILGAPYFKNISKYIHKNDQEMLQDYKKNAGYTANILNFENIDNLITVEDGQNIDFFNDTFKVIHTPGHTKGSSCFIFMDTLMFSGDTIFKEGVGRCDLYGGSSKEIKNSIKKIKALNKDYIIFPGHGEKTTLKDEKNFNYYFNA